MRAPPRGGDTPGPRSDVIRADPDPGSRGEGMASGSSGRRSCRFPSTVAAFAVLSLVPALVQSLPAQAASGPSLDSAGFGPVVRESLHNDLSAPLSSMQAAPFRTETGHSREI